MNTLRQAVIKLATENSSLRKHLIPILRKVAIEFPSEEALKEYMKEHPDADPKNHTVKKEEKAQGNKEKAKPFSKTRESFIDDIIDYFGRDAPNTRAIGGMLRRWEEANTKPGKRDWDSLEKKLKGFPDRALLKGDEKKQYLEMAEEFFSKAKAGDA